MIVVKTLPVSFFGAAARKQERCRRSAATSNMQNRRLPLVVVPVIIDRNGSYDFAHDLYLHLLVKAVNHFTFLERQRRVHPLVQGDLKFPVSSLKRIV